MRVFPDRMLANIESTRGLVFSQRTMLALVEAGMPREAAYRLAQRHAAATWEEGGDFRERVAADPDARKLLSGPQIAALFDYAYYTANVDALFERVGLADDGATI